MVLYEPSKKGPGDVIATEPGGITYTRISAAIDNDDVAAGFDLHNPIGYPVMVSDGGGRAIAMAGDEASVVGIIVTGPPIEELAQNGTTPGKYAILARGPATVRPSGIATADPAGDDYDVDAILTALAALDPPILAVDEVTEMTYTLPES